MENAIKIRARRTAWDDRVDILIQSKKHNAMGYSIGTIIMEQVEEGTHIEPSTSLTITNAQLLMDDLWYAGLRPTEGTGSAGALKATENHLEDMRKIVFKKMGM